MEEESIFAGAIEKSSPEERGRYLDEACAGNAALRTRIEQLLEAYFEPDPRLDAPPDEVVVQAASETALEAVGSTISRYRLLEQIGEGGMGIVYVAEQLRPVARKVALKVIKPGMDTKDVIGRFEAERQALAMMDHPGVAKVLDAGATESGRPYFVMELVRGVPLTDFSDEQQLGTRERLQLFIEVCRAVQHAHQKGIIHRDLKPSNVLVGLFDGRPMPKVIDFGVAKALSQKLTEKTVYTGYGQMLGTPLYMSPEQAALSMNDVDTRSDVYSLGVLLYELLTGTPPFDKETLETAGFDEFRRLLREVDPPRPSARLSTLKAEALSTVSDRRGLDPRKMSRHLRGELDWIVMKALEKDRNRRYESASAFAADIERYLNNEPVQACPPTIGYRFSKFARRHRASMLTGAVVALALFIAAGVSVSYGIQAELARKAANNAKDEANQRLAGEMHARKEAEEQRQLANEARDEANLQKQRSEESFTQTLQAVERLLSRVGYENLLNTPHTIQLRRAILQDALDMFEEIHAKHRDDPLVRHSVATAFLQIGDAYAGHDRGRSESCYRSALPLLQELTKEYPENLPFRLELADTYCRICWHVAPTAEEKRVNAESAIILLRGLLEDPALAGAENLDQLNFAGRINRPSTFWLSTEPVERRVVASKLVDIYATHGAWLMNLNRLNEAQQSFEAALTLIQQNPIEHDAIANFYASYATTKKGEDLITCYTQQIESGQAGLRDQPDSYWYREVLFRAVISRARAYIRMKRYESALADASVIFELATKILHVSPSESSRRMHEEARLMLITLLQNHIERTTALRTLRRLVDTAPDEDSFHTLLAKIVLLDEDPNESLGQLSELSAAFPMSPVYLTSLAEMHWRAGLKDDAVAELQEAVAKKPDDAGTRLALIETLMAMDDQRQARCHIRALMAILISSAGDSYGELYQAGLLSCLIPQRLDYQAHCEMMLKRFAQDENVEAWRLTAWTCALGPTAIDDYAPAITLARRAVEADPGNKQYLTGLGAILMRAGKHEEARKVLNQAQEATAVGEISTGYIYYFQAMTEHHLGHVKDAKEHLRKANQRADAELVNSPSWNRKLTLKLLRQEAEALIKPEDNN